MSKCVIPDHYPNQIDVTRTPLAYGDRAVPRLNRELHDETLLTRQRALRSLCDYLHDPEHIAISIKEGIPRSLKGLLTSKDPFSRYKAAECLFVLSCNYNGRKSLVEQGIIESLAVLFNDTEAEARKNSHKTVEMLSELPFGAEGIVNLKLIKTLVEKLKNEIEPIKELILDTLHFCMFSVDTQQALDAKALTVFTDLLKSPQVSIRTKAARNVFDITIPLQGKMEALELQTVPLLVGLLNDHDVNCRSKAALALETIAITTPGKYKILKEDTIKSLIPLIRDDQSEMRVNALKVITCLSEAPEGRKELLDYIKQVREAENDPVPNVAKHAQIATKVITWKP